MSLYWYCYFLPLLMIVSCDRSFLYNSEESSFVNWSIKIEYANKSVEIIKIQNVSQQILLEMSHDIHRYTLRSPLIETFPAWKFDIKFRTFTNNQPTPSVQCESCFHRGIRQFTNINHAKDQMNIGQYTYPKEEEKSFEAEMPPGIHYRYYYFGFIVDNFQQRITNKGFHIFNVTLFQVTYLNCPEIVRGLAYYENVPGSRSDNDPKVTEGKCVQHAERADGYNKLERNCRSDGSAAFVGQCWCLAGYELSEDGQKCVECGRNFYRSEKMKEKNITQCLKCGRNSKGFDDGKKCSCIDGRYRFKDEVDDWSKECHAWLSRTNEENGRIFLIAYPDPPTALVVRSKSNDSVQLTWRTPPVPSMSGNIQLEQVDCTNVFQLKWKEPTSKGGPPPEFLYSIECPGFSKDVRGEGKDTGTSITINHKENTLKCTITPKSKVGAGKSIQTNTADVCNDGSSTSSIGAVIGGTIAAVLVVLMVILAILYRIHMNDKQKKSAIDQEILIMEAVQELMRNRTRNIYVRATLDSSVVDLGGEEPTYEKVPSIGYLYPYDKLNKLDELGEGNFAKVFRAEAWDICGNTGKSTVAVKELKLAECDEADREDFEGELQLMQELKHHPNVVRLLGICSAPHRCMIVEYLPGGDLLGFLLKSRKYHNLDTTTKNAEGSFLSSENLLEFAWQISKGMKHIADHDVCHRDLACRNILVGYNRICKVADLGLARKLNDQGIYKREKQAKLPVKWLPPESIRFGRSSKKSDVWSFGILLWEIVTIGGVPYPEYKSKDVPQLLREGYRMSKPEHCEDEIYELMTDCWSETEDIRPSFLQISKVLEKMKDRLKPYINLNDYKDDAYLPLEDNDVEFQDVEFKDDGDLTVVHNV